MQMTVGGKKVVLSGSVTADHGQEITIDGGASATLTIRFDQPGPHPAAGHRGSGPTDLLLRLPEEIPDAESLSDFWSINDLSATVVAVWHHGRVSITYTVIRSAL